MGSWGGYCLHMGVGQSLVEFLSGVLVMIYGLQLQWHHSLIPPCPHLHPFVEVGSKGLHNEMALGSCMPPILHQTNHKDDPTI